MHFAEKHTSVYNVHMSSFTTADSKIHILYLVKNAPGVSYQMLLDKCMESLYIDFFTFCEVYNELIAGNLMDKKEIDTGTGEVVGNNETLSITKGGEAILEDVESTLNKQVLAYLKKAASELKEAVEDTNSVKAFSEPSGDNDNTYTVSLSSTKGGRDFNASFKVSSKEMADAVCRSWRQRSGRISGVFIDELLKM